MENLSFVSVLDSGALRTLEGELKDEYKRILLAIKEAIDFSGLAVRTLKLFYDENVFIFDEFETGKILIALGNKEIDIEKLKEEILVKKAPAKKAPEKEEVVEKPVDEEIFDKVFEITVKHLSAFGEMVFENVLKEMKINKKNCPLRLFRRFVRSLENSAQMIVGPSKAKEMSKEILDLIK
jgi:hypothetical protein